MERSQRENRQEISCTLCSILDNVGFSESMRKCRTHAYELESIELTKKCQPFAQVFITGSKAEATALPLNSDTDYMIIWNDVICLSSHETNAHFTTLKASESHDVPHGYVKVTATNIVLQTGLGEFCEMSFLHTDNDGYPIVCSAILRNYTSQILAALPLLSYDFLNCSFEGTCGPAITLSFHQHRMDHVYAIYYYESSYLSRWSSRNQFRSWPSADMISEISTVEGYIVPVGSLEGYFTNIEWRVSYVTAENKLMQHLNESQFKLYVMLKMIAKEMIKSDFPVCSSYVIKNVVLWVCELSSKSFFRRALFIEQIAKCLNFIKVCVFNNHLPNYFIPERNLFSSRLDSCSKQNLIVRLNYLIEHRDSIYCCLQTFTKHSFLLTFGPTMKEAYGKKRDKIEKCVLLLDILALRKFELPFLTRSSMVMDVQWASYQDISFLPIFLKLQSLVVPEWMDLFLSGDLLLISQLLKIRLQYFLK